MRIAMLAPPYLPIRPDIYTGSEKVISILTDGLVARGHDVTLFASGDSQTSAKLVSVLPEHLGEATLMNKNALLPLLHYSSCFKRANEFDIIHNHAQHLPHFLTDTAGKPVVHTLHTSLYRDEVPEEVRTVMRHFKQHHFVSVSRSQQKGLPELNYAGYVYNGIDVLKYEADIERSFDSRLTSGFAQDTKDSQSYLLWVGHMTQVKGPFPAIRTAKALGIPLHIVGMVRDYEQAYFTKVIKPEIDGKLIYFHDLQTFDELNDLYKHAAATLFPISWHEPFGVIMAESMACGTPVIAYDFGAVDEVVRDAETGFIVSTTLRDSIHDWTVRKKDVDGLIQAVEMLRAMPEEKYIEMRKACRARVAEYFTAEKMVEGYEKIYMKLLNC